MCKQVKLNNETKMYINLQTKELLDLEKVSALPDNAMLKVKPELWIEWNFEKNNELGLDIWEMTKGSEKKAWWLCAKCNDTYPQTMNSKNRGNGCSICTGRYVTLTNCLATKNPKISKQWHPTKNGNLTPYHVTESSGKRVWWLCEKKHCWKASVGDRKTGYGCPYCDGKKVWIGFNDMWTTNPELASLLANPEDGYKFMQNSHKKVDWKCPCCDEIIKNKTISDINKIGVSCPICSDGISFPEKFMYSLLNNLSIEFEFQKIFKWSGKKRYDFYIPSLNMIIETHGDYHYREKNRKDGKKLKDTQENDKYKYELALTNGIKSENYIVIDCRKSDFNFIKNNILNSQLAEIFDLEDVFSNFKLEVRKSFVLEAWKLHNENSYTPLDIANILKLSRDTIVRYLFLGNELGKCNYIQYKTN